MVILCTIDLETREVSLPAGQVIASYDHNVDVIRFQAEAIPGFSLDTSSIKIAAQGPNKARHDYSVDPSTVSIEEETGYITFDWPIPQGVTEMPIGSGFKYGDKGQLIFAVCAEIIDGSTVSKAWHSDDGIITVVAHLEPEAGGGEDPEEEATNRQMIGQLRTDLTATQTEIDSVILTTYDDLAGVLADGVKHSAYACGRITVNSPITLTERSVTNVKSFSDGVFVLNSTLFTWETPSSYHASPNFVNCTFIGNGNSLFVDGAYVLGGKFVNCKFINCSIVQNGKLVQSMRFVNCYFENAVDTPLIHAKQVYETRFISCQAESPNKGIIVDAYGTDENMITIHQLSFLDCIFEGQTNYIVRTHDGDVVINNCYTETNSMSFAKFLASNRANTPMLRVKISDCKINPTANVFFVDIDSSYEGAKWSFFTCYDSGISVGKLVNTNNLYLFAVERCSVTSGGKLLPSKELSKVYQLKNSIVDFTTPGHCIVKKFPCLITFDSYEGGYRTNLYFVSLSGSSNRPLVICLSDPTKTPTATYDSETGYVDVTLHSARQNFQNTSAVLLNGLTNNLVRNDYWDIVYSGYSV